MTEQIPLYLGIPLAGLCVAVIVAVLMFVIAILRGKA